MNFLRHLALILFFASMFLLAPKAFAANGSCTSIYGGGQSCPPPSGMTLNKTAQNPQSGAFVENLGLNDAKLQPDQNTNFHVTLTNTGGNTIKKIVVEDTFPQFVTVVSGAGNVDVKTNKVTFDILDLKPGESRTFTLTGKVASQSALPADKAVVCVTNTVKATNTDKAASMLTDTAQLCIAKQGQPSQITTTITPQQVLVTPGPKAGQPAQVTKGGLKVFPAPEVTQTPPTGPEMLALIGLLPLGGIGILLRKKALQ